MESTLRRKTAHIKSLGRDVELVELSYSAQMEIMDAYANGKSALAGPIMIKHGVVEFHDEDIEAIGNNLPLKVVIEMSEAVSDHSGLMEDHEKKSENAQA